MDSLPASGVTETAANTYHQWAASPFRDGIVPHSSKNSFVFPSNAFSADVAQFLWNLYLRIAERDVEGIRKSYELDFNLISDQYYGVFPWPETAVVGEFYRKNNCSSSLVELFYGELTYRHLFAKCKEMIKAEDRQLSWENYVALFMYFTDEECGQSDSETPTKLVLPVQWVWDIHDEFVYQFHDNCRWKASMAENLPEDEAALAATLQELKKTQEVWSAAEVFQILHQVVDASGISDFLKKNKGDVSRSNQGLWELRYQLGYFSMIALLRMYTILGEYTLAVQAVSDIDISPRSYYAESVSSYTTFSYYLGFSYMMLRRYQDAIRVFSQFLLHVGKQRNTGQAALRWSGYLAKQMDRMHMLLMLCDLLTVTRVDDFLTQTLKDKYAEKFNKVQLDNPDAIREVFNMASPKFVNAGFSAFENKQAIREYFEVESEKQENQVNYFIQDVMHQKKVAEIQSFAKLYNNIQLSKLASLMDLKSRNPTDTMRAEIMSIKHKARQFVWSNGPLLTGELVPCSPTFEFFLDCDVVYVKSLITQKVYAEDFMKYLSRSEDLLAAIQSSTQYKPIKDREIQE